MSEKIISVKINVEDQSLEQLENNLKDVNAEIIKVESTASKFSLEDKIQAADGAIKVMAGSLSAVVGALGVLGVETEAFGEFEKKAASVIALSIGLKDTAEGVGKLTIAYQKAGGAAALFGKVSKRALISTGIGALVVALGTIVAYYDDIVDFLKNINGELKKENDLLQKQKKELGFNYDLLEAQKATMIAQGKSVEDINKELKKELEAQLDINEALLLNLKTQLEREQASNREVSLWEKIKIGVTAAYQPAAAGVEYAKAINSESEETIEKQDKINDILLQQEGIRKKLADLTKEEGDNAQTLKDKEQARLEEFQQVLQGYITGLQDLKADSDQKVLDLEKERARKAIEVLELEKDEKEKVLDAFEKFFEQKQKNLTKIQLEESQRRLEDQKGESIQIQEDLFDARMRQLEAEASTLEQRQNLLENYRQKELIDSRTAEEEKQQILRDSYAQLIEDQGDNIEAQVVLLNQLRTDSTAIAETGARERSAINKEYAALLAQLAAEEKIREAEVQEFKVNVAANAALALSEALTTIFAQSKEAAIAGVVIEKAAAIAQIVAATAVANAKLVAAFPITLGQPWVGINTIAAGLSIATTVAQAAQAINQINNPSTSAGGGGGSFSGISGGTAPSGGSSANANTPAPIPEVPQISPCIRTYVLSGDVTSSQEADAKLNRKRNIA